MNVQYWPRATLSLLFTQHNIIVIGKYSINKQSKKSAKIDNHSAVGVECIS